MDKKELNVEDIEQVNGGGIFSRRPDIQGGPTLVAPEDNTPLNPEFLDQDIQVSGVRSLEYGGRRFNMLN